MKKISVAFLLTLGLGLLLFSCYKPGPGGKAVIKGVVKYRTKPIPGATVYIKYGAKEFPGNNVTYYDASVNADASANYEFDNLRKGDYYLFGVGYDTAIALTVSGGIYSQITSKSETDNVDVPVE